MNILYQCKKCEKRPLCRLGEHKYYQVACEHGCPSFKQKQKKTVTLTNFDRIKESPEALAEKVVYLVTDKYDDGTEWHSVLVNGGWRTREEAVAATIKWLNKEAEK